MDEHIELSASAIRYLLALKALGHDGGGIRSVDIAAALGLSKPSVHNMMKTFDEMGLVSKNAYGAAYLTRLGKEIADRYGRYYDSVSELLQKSFPDGEMLMRLFICCFRSCRKKALTGWAEKKKVVLHKMTEIMCALTVATVTLALSVGMRIILKTRIFCEKKRKRKNGQDCT